jgi:hypothetical protein
MPSTRLTDPSLLGVSIKYSIEVAGRLSEIAHNPLAAIIVTSFLLAIFKVLMAG